MLKNSVKRILPAPVLRGLKAARKGARNAVVDARKYWNRPNLYRRGTPERIGAVYTASTHLSIPERLFLYTLVRGTRPRRVLEIGSAVGGSASIMAAAMEDNNSGKIVGIDPVRLFDPGAARYYGRFTLLNFAAPQGLKEAYEACGGAFDLVFYDGPNIYSEVKRNIEAFLPFLATRAQIVFDNGMHYGVNKAVMEAIEANPKLHDSGLVCTTPGTYDALVAYNGLRLVRFDPDAVSDPQPLIDGAYQAAGRASPSYDPAVVEHDIWWCREIRACAKCAEKNATGARKAP